MAHNEQPVFTGYLLLPPSGKKPLKKSWQQKYCMLYKQSCFGIERLEVHDSLDEALKNTCSPSKIVTLESVIKITPFDYTNTIMVTTRNPPYYYEFGATDDQAMSQWIAALQTVVFPNSSAIASSSSIEDNDLYCSSDETIFIVKFSNSAASLRCGLDPSKVYTLILTDTAIQLWSATEDTVLFTWPYCYIRRYGPRDGRLTFEAGRKCVSGEGAFYIEHADYKNIARCMAAKMKSMKELLKNSTAKSPVDSSNIDIRTALNLEAGSRSPITPLAAATVCSTLNEIDANLLPEFRCNTSENSNSWEKLLSHSTTVVDSEYDSIQFRKDAWRTHGINDVNHVENVNNSMGGIQIDGNLTTMARNIKRTPENISCAVSPILLTPSTVKKSALSNDYDHLDFLSTDLSSNRNPTRDSSDDYKVVQSQAGTDFKKNCSGNYDQVVNCSQMMNQYVPLRDDYQLGYVVLKDKEPPDALNSSQTLEVTSVNHRFHNSEPYAVISKPKRV